MSDDIQPATPAEVERYTGEHAVVPEDLTMFCLCGEHADCCIMFYTVKDDRHVVQVTCQCPCHEA